MSNFARIINSIAVDVSASPGEHFHPEIAAQFVACPDNVTIGSLIDGNGTWTIAAPSVANSIIETQAAPKMSPVQFKLLFTVQERVAIKGSDDPFVKDFFEIVNDPRLTFVDLALESTQQALAYLAAKNLIAAERPAQILIGVIQ